MGKNNHLTTVLACAGVIPFLLCALLSSFSNDYIPALGRILQITQSYGLLILSFMCGIHWATQLYQSNKVPFNLFFISNIIVIGVWLQLLVVSLGASLLGLAFGFGLLLWIDSRLKHAEIIDSDYYRMRFWVTIVVIICLVICANNARVF